MIPPPRLLSSYSPEISRSTMLFIPGGGQLSVNQSAAVTHPMLLCLHHLLNMCFVLFEDDELVLQNSRLITTSTQTHMQNQVFTGIQSHIAEVTSDGISKAPISYISIWLRAAGNDNTTNYSNDNATKEIGEFCIPLAGYLPGFAIFLAGLFLHSPLPAFSL